MEKFIDVEHTKLRPGKTIVVYEGVLFTLQTADAEWVLIENDDIHLSFSKLMSTAYLEKLCVVEL